MLQKARPTKGVLQPAPPSQQKRQQALAACLDAVQRLGYGEGTPEEAASGNDLTVLACKYVQAAGDLSSLQAEIEAKENECRYGSLLQLPVLKHKAGTLDDGNAALDFLADKQERLVDFLQQPYSGPCIAIESGHQQSLTTLLQLAIRDAGLLSGGSDDLEWILRFKEPSSVWTKLLQPTPHLAAISGQCHEGLAALVRSVLQVPVTSLKE